MHGYLSNDDVTDNLFDYIYRKAWDEREIEPEPPTQQPEAAVDAHDIPGEWTEITDPAEIAEIEAIFSEDKPQTAAVKLYEELSPSGKDTTAYYLFHNPDGIDAPAPLVHETLSLIKERADTFVICAEVCYLSESEMEQWNIGFRKMPRDWNLLPGAVQEQIRAIRPEYEQQWIESTRHERGFEEWQKTQESAERSEWLKQASKARGLICSEWRWRGGLSMLNSTAFVRWFACYQTPQITSTKSPAALMKPVTSTLLTSTKSKGDMIRFGRKQKRYCGDCPRCDCGVNILTRKV